MEGGKEIRKKEKNGHLLKRYGSWMYCDGCQKTVGYLCYTTYHYFMFRFKCRCGNEGYFELQRSNKQAFKTSEAGLVKIKNRLCCPEDQSPLFSIVEKRLEEYQYQVICQACGTKYGDAG